MGLLIRIVLAFMKVSAIAFGGAYATIPLVEEEAVVVQGWMTYGEFADLIAIDEITPGPILINSATFVGMRVAGIPGAIAATVGCIIIPCIFVMILLVLYRRFHDSALMEGAMVSLKCMAVALIASTFIKLGLNALLPEGVAPDLATGIFSVAVICGAFYLINQKKISPLPVMLGCGAVNLLAHLLFL
ncbi:MAG TPA: chromate transporter [Atopobiaceae bacterium]|nr:chromate transporter [Coriobacteriales bacterium OH1046]HQE69902.1 chromate transporter [Atopobiaceae bacterium]